MTSVGWRVRAGWMAWAWAVAAAACGSSASSPAGSGSGGNAGAGGGAGAPGGSGGSAGAAVDGSAGGGNSDGAVVPPPVNDPKFTAFCGAARDEVVRLFDRCRGVAPEVAKLLVNRDVCKWWGAALGGGRMAFDATGADACITALRAMPCDADAIPPICDRALWGTLHPGDRCSMVAQQVFSECETGTICVAGMNACEGKCVKRALLMQPCGFSTPCVAGESCSIKTGTCTLKGGLGSTCGFESADCQDGLYCTDLFTSGTCMQRQAVGAKCSADDNCAPPAACDKGGALTGTCKVPPRPGDPCVPDEFTCWLALMYCGADMKCHPQAGIGQPCGMKNGGEIPCAVGTCNTNLPNPICEKSAAMAGCFIDSECGPDSLCALQNFSLSCTAVCTPW